MGLFNRLFDSTPVNNVSPSEAQKKLAQKPKPFLLDVRQPEEFRTGHIPGAKLIPLGELTTRLKELPANQEIIVVCQSGSRSLSATRKLSGAGYNVFNLRGGMNAWYHAGMPMTRGK